MPQPMTSNPQPKPYRYSLATQFSPIRPKSRYVSIQENRASRKASLMILASQKVWKQATFQPLFLFPRHQAHSFDCVFVEQPNCFAFKTFIIHRKYQTTNSDDTLTIFYLSSSPTFLLNSGSLLPPY